MSPYQRKGRPGIISGFSQEGKLTASSIKTSYTNEGEVRRDTDTGAAI
jgi:hypothetical protein